MTPQEYAKQALPAWGSSSELVYLRNLISVEIQAAELRGAERMRERCAEQAIIISGDIRLATALAALPLEEQ